MTRRETFARFVPARFASIALLLVVVILLTPVLLSSGPAAVGLLTQAELIVDRVPGANLTHFYLRGVGTTVRYTQMSIEVATGFNWTGSFPTGRLAWSNGTNGSELLTLSWATDANPVALNISAWYQASGTSALYLGVVAFDFRSASGALGETLYSATSTSGLAVSGPTPISSLPVTVPLVDVGSGP